MAPKLARHTLPKRVPRRKRKDSNSSTEESPAISSPAPASKKQKSHPKSWKLLVSMDYGTKTLAMAYRIAKPGELPAADNVRDVHFSEREAFAPQKAAWGKDGRFYWGYEIEDQITNKNIDRENVIEHWKMLLYKSHETSDLVQQVEGQLGERTLEELISTHMTEVMKTAKQHIKNNESTEYSAKDIDELPVILFLSVPQMWKPPACAKMSHAARNASVDYVELVYEPQCAAAYYTHDMKDRMPKQMKAGDVLLVADIGGGTGDFVSYQIRHDSDSGAKVGLKTVRRPEGALCGSEFVNRSFLYWAMARYDLGKISHDLGISREACNKKLLTAFDIVKESFRGPTDETLLVPISGAPGAKEAYFIVQLNGRDITNFFDLVIDKIIQCIDQQREDKQDVKALYIPGGFGRSEYLHRRLKAKYDGVLNIMGKSTDVAGAYQPVSRGALLRYDDIMVRGVPSKDSFGIGQDEQFDPSLHPDAAENKKLVETCEYDADMQVVHERWRSLMSKENFKEHGQTFTTEVWSYYPLGIKDTEIEVRIYWTDMNIQDHEPVLQGVNAKDSEPRDGIEIWDDLVMKVPNSIKKEFKATESETKGRIYELFYRLILQRDGANINVKWQIAKPGTAPYDADGNQRESKVELMKDEIYELCDQKHNPFARLSVS